MPVIPSAALSYPAGNDIKIKFTVTDRYGVIVNITPHTIRFSAGPPADPVISTAASPATALIVKTSPTIGIFELQVVGEVTQDLRGSYPWQAEIEDASGAKATVHEGMITFSRDLVWS